MVEWTAVNSTASWPGLRRCGNVTCHEKLRRFRSLKGHDSVCLQTALVCGVSYSPPSWCR